MGGWRGHGEGWQREVGGRRRGSGMDRQVGEVGKV